MPIFERLAKFKALHATIRDLDPQSDFEVELVASRMGETLVEVLGESRGKTMYSGDWLRQRVLWHLDPKSTIGKVFLCEQTAGTISGHAIVRIETDEGGNTFGYFSTIYVAPEARGNGIASAFIIWVERWLSDEGLGRVAYNTAASNHRLIALFSQHGYEVSLARDDMVQLSKKLPDSSIRPCVSAYLDKLQVTYRQPSLTYLNELIRSHLHHIPYESLSKVLDTDRHWEFGGYIPPLRLATERILTKRMGGTCWVLARSFAALLGELGFDAGLVHMDPGHLCIRVNIDKNSYYVDVGYGAPLFRAFPLKESFVINAPSEVFSYSVEGAHARVARTPGPTKTLTFAPIALDHMRSAVAFANRWETSRHLKILTASRFRDGSFVRLVWNIFKDWRSGALQETVLTDRDVAQSLDQVFGVDPDLFFAARDLLAKRGITAESYNQPPLP